MAALEKCAAVRSLSTNPASWAQGVHFGGNVRVGQVALEALEAARSKDLATHERNIPIIERNRHNRSTITNIMAEVGILETYRAVQVNSRARFPKAITQTAGYVADMARELPVSDGFNDSTLAYERLKPIFEKFLADAITERDAAATARETAAERARQERLKNVELAEIILRHELARDATWEGVRDALRAKDQRLDLAVAMMQTHGDWSDGFYRVSDAIDRFTIQDDTDKAILNDVMGCMQDDDGRIFRDTAWSYDRLFADAYERVPQLAADLCDGPEERANGMTNTRAIGRNKFPIETRPYGDARRPFAVIACSKCHRDEAVTIKPDEGVQKAKIYFRAKGWLIGSSRATDVCPTCRNQKPRMSGVSTPSRRRAAYNRIEAKLAKVEETEIVEVVLGPMAGHLAPLALAMKLNTPAPAVEPDRPVRIATEAPKPRQSRRPPPVSRQTAEREARLGLVPDPPRGAPSPADRRQILDALEDHYDVDKGLYRGKSGDALLSEKLNLPRVWIAELRDQFMGGPDKNEAGVARVGQLDEAIALAEGASRELLEMAQRAETICADLKAARTKLLG